MSDPDAPIPALFATIHHRSDRRPDGYTTEDISLLNVQANKHIPELHAALVAAHNDRYPSSPASMDSEYSVDEHSHRFAAWAAARAASVIGCRFTVSQGKSLMEAISFSGVPCTADDLPPADQIDEVHRAWRERMIDVAQSFGLPITHGIAAKLINVYLKARFVSGVTAYHPHVASIHPPIDRLLLHELAATKFGGDPRPWRKARDRGWSNFTSVEYEDVINRIRTHLNGQPLWTIEKYWRGYQ